MAPKMARKQKNWCPSNITVQPRLLIDRSEIMKLTKVAKSWDFTCSFCFKKFPSAQALGGHQNAHRSERMEEKRLFVRDPIGYRKRAYITSLNSSPIEVAPNPALNRHAAARMVKRATANFRVFRGPPKILPKPPLVLPAVGFGGFNAAVNGKSNYFFQPYSGKISLVRNVNGGNLKTVNVMNFFPLKELNLAESVGVGAGEACSKDQYSYGGYQKVDLTLRL